MARRGTVLRVAGAFLCLRCSWSSWRAVATSFPRPASRVRRVGGSAHELTADSPSCFVLEGHSNCEKYNVSLLHCAGTFDT